MDKLTSAELAQVWAQYLNDSGSACILSYFYETTEDKEIKDLVKTSLNLSKKHIENINDLFKDEGHVVPHGFTLEEDVNLKASKLFTDNLVLHFIHQMAKVGMTTYAAAVSGSSRNDIEDHFVECLSETTALHHDSKDLLIKKGVYNKAPMIPQLTQVEYVRKQGFVLDGLGEKRPLLAPEIGNLFSNIQRNELGAAILTGFSQVAKSKDVTNFFIRGIDIAKKHIRLFGGKLSESNLPTSTSYGDEVTTSTEMTFSDRLMMFFTTGMIGLSIGYYGTGVSQSPRIDLGVLYNRLSLEIQLYSEDGANIMIKNHWMEQPPIAADRDELTKK